MFFFVISSKFIINCYDYSKSGQRDAEVEWLEMLGYNAESRRKVVRSRLLFAIRRLENSLSAQQLNEYLFRIGKDKAAK